MPALVLLLVLTGITPLFALDVRLTAPKFGIDPNGSLVGNPSANAIVNWFDTEFAATFSRIQDSTNAKVGKIKSDPEQLIGAFGNASVFASDGASQRTFGGYKFLAITTGSMFGFKLPEKPFTILKEMDSIGETVKKDGDVPVGLNFQAFNVQAGINASKFLLKNLYLGLKFGVMKMDLENVSFNTFSIGALGNYQLIPHLNLGVFEWRGINLGTGLIYQGTKFWFDIPLDPETHNIDMSAFDSLGITWGAPGNKQITKYSTINMDLNVHTITIPLEAMTAIRVVAVNIPFGVGIDVALGSSKLTTSLSTDVRFEDLPDGLIQTQPANMTMTMGGNHRPVFFNPKIMTGIGFNMGPMIFDIPITFYISDNMGYNIGVTLGFIL